MEWKQSVSNLEGLRRNFNFLRLSSNSNQINYHLLLVINVKATRVFLILPGKLTAM